MQRRAQAALPQSGGSRRARNSHRSPGGQRRAPHLEHPRHRAAAPAGWIAVRSGPLRVRGRQAGAAAAAIVRAIPIRLRVLRFYEDAWSEFAAAPPAPGSWGVVAVIPAGLRKWAAIGSGAGLEIAGPRGSESLASFRGARETVRARASWAASRWKISSISPRRAWGADYAAFLGKLGIRHVAANVVLPRHEVIVRQLALPGVSGKDLAGAVQFQLDGLHPYNEDDVVSSWTRLEHSSTVLVAIVRGDVVQRYATLFAEAGIKIAGFTCSAAAIYSALRLFGDTPPAEILAYEAGESDVEIYGESPAKPVFSAAFNIAGARSGTRRGAGLARNCALNPRLPCARCTRCWEPIPRCPTRRRWPPLVPALCLPLNLLPVEQRQTSSPMVWVPSTVLAALVLLAAGATTALPGFENRRYLREINAEIAKVQPAAARAAAIDREIDLTRKRTLLLDAFRARSKADMDVLAEMTRLLAPPAWLTSLDLNGQQVAVTGETDQAAVLLKAIDASPQFESSEFVSPPAAHARRARCSASGPRARPAARGSCHEDVCMRTLEPREKKAVIALGATLALTAVVLAYEFWPAGIRRGGGRISAVRAADGAAPGAGARNRRHGSRKTGNSQESRGRPGDPRERADPRRNRAAGPGAGDHHPARTGRRRKSAHRHPRHELGAIAPFGDDYGAVNVSIQVECRIEQLLNFLAALAARPELIATRDLRVIAADPKQKTLNVRITVAGIVPKSLAPQKKGA